MALLCDSRAPEVVELAATFRREAESDFDFARRIYSFVANRIRFAITPPPDGGVVETLEIAEGACLDKAHVLMALARAGGLPARFCHVEDRRRIRDGAEPEPISSGRWLLEALGGDIDQHRLHRFLSPLQWLEGKIRRMDVAALPRDSWQGHPYVELRIGDAWIPADPSFGDDEAAGLGLALPRFGFEPLRLWGLVGGAVEHSEEIRWPLRRYVVARQMFCLVVCRPYEGEFRCLNEALEDARRRGRRRLEEVGVEGYLQQMSRFYQPVCEAAAF